MGRRLVLLAMLAGMAVLAGLPPANAASGRSHPKTAGLLDCNGGSPLQRPLLNVQCVDVAGRAGQRFEDNGQYVGHDEPAQQFFSRTPGSGNSQQYRLTLPREPSRPPTGSFRGPAWDFQLFPTFWYSMTLCDTQSFPETTHVCTPDSDVNVQTVPTPSHAGAAVLELQFYPPGWSSIRRGQISCDQTHWCAALTIDSLEGNFDFSNLNTNCEEPVNFAFEQRNGIPTGPPGPDTANPSTRTPNSQTLLMNPGDRLVVSMHDTPGGLSTRVRDLSTGRTGRMVASAHNGFRHIVWDPVGHTCHGRPYSFHPMFSTAAPPTASGQPRAWAEWSAHTINVATSWEIGHFEKGTEKDPDALPCFSGPVIPGCVGTDVDFDGYPYRPLWPNGSSRLPTPTFTSSPRSLDAAGRYANRFPLYRNEADIPAVDRLCDVTTGTNCPNPPHGAAFYPWYHIGRAHGGCAYTLSNDFPGMLSNFGGEHAAWGPIERTNEGGGLFLFLNFATHTIRNPCP